VEPAAQGAPVGALFRYAIESPVTLASQKSAMLPIVNDAVKAEKLALFSAETDDKHPRSALRLTNDTKLHLMQGPLTIFDGGEYAGDAQIEDLAPDSNRLVTYALDLNVEVAEESTASALEDTVAVAIREGQVEATKRRSRTSSYIVKNSHGDARRVIIEQPLEDSWKLVAPETPLEKTRDAYRFLVEARPGEAARLEVTESHETRTVVAMIDLGPEDPFGGAASRSVKGFDASAYELARSLRNPSPKLREALDTWRSHQTAYAEAQRERDQIAQKVASAVQEQARIRENLKQVPAEETKLRNRFIMALEAHEDQIAELRVQHDLLTGDILKKQQTLADFLLKLQIE
jgi:hypothetical protein